jgi:hypothetical protein
VLVQQLDWGIIFIVFSILPDSTVVSHGILKNKQRNCSKLHGHYERKENPEK